MTLADMYLRMLQKAVEEAHGPEVDKQAKLRQGFPLVRHPSDTKTRATSSNVIRVEFGRKG